MSTVQVIVISPSNCLCSRVDWVFTVQVLHFPLSELRRPRLGRNRLDHSPWPVNSWRFSSWLRAAPGALFGLASSVFDLE